MKPETINWFEVARIMLTSRAMDDLEESELVPQKKILYQFSARGHELAQILLGMHLTNSKDVASAYYRSRPLMLTLGFSPEEAFASNMAKKGGYSEGRDIGVVSNLPGNHSAMVLPMAGDVGSQYTPGTGYAQAIQLSSDVMEDDNYKEAISVVLGGDGSVATNGFWSAIVMATTLHLPVLFFIEDNGYGISVESDIQTPGGNVANNFYSFKNLKIYKGSGTDPEETTSLITEATTYVRERKGPALLRVKVPRLNGHSYQDNQAYKATAVKNKEQKEDPVTRLKAFLVPKVMSETEWKELSEASKNTVIKAAKNAWSRKNPVKEGLLKALYQKGDGVQKVGGLYSLGHKFPKSSYVPQPGKQRINMVESIRKTLENELYTNKKLLVFGEDVGTKGGVHAVTMGLQARFGESRVFDTSLSEEGIIGRAVGLAYAGFMPVAEIQFRKYADPATEQIKNTGTIRWRTSNKFAAPMVVRMPGGFAKCGDPWHSESNEVFFAKNIGWQVVFPSNAEDAAGLLRTAMRDNNPTIFFEHRNLLDSKYARRPYPGDDFVVPIGKACILQEGKDMTIVTWGAMCERAETAVKQSNYSVEVIDLRTIRPWDKTTVFESIQKTNRCLIVHEDTRTAGFGAEIAASISDELFCYLDAPVKRLAMPDIPMAYSISLMNEGLPSSHKIKMEIENILNF